VTFGLRLTGNSPSGDGLHLLRLIGDTPDMREMSVAEQRYQAVSGDYSGSTGTTALLKGTPCWRWCASLRGRTRP